MKNRRILIFGRPGQGKTTLAVLEMLDALRNGYFVYSNIKINWFGNLYKLGLLEKTINKIYTFFTKPFFSYRQNKIQKLDIQKMELEELNNNAELDENGIPNIDLTDLFYEKYWLEKKIKKEEQINKWCINGLIQEHYYPPSRYCYTDDLQQATELIIKKATEFPDEKYMLVLDEGFIELEHGSRVPRYITNFLNQSRKLNLDVIVSSQRPIAVYPSYRAICDYMIQVEKKHFNRFGSKLYYVDDNANALPDLSQDKEGKDKGEHYTDFKGKEIYPFFDTRQSIGIIKLLNKNL